jgi:hypothetical protein
MTQTDVSVTALSPNTGPNAGGTAVTVTGTGFTNFVGKSIVSAVNFGTVAATAFAVTSSTELTAVSPAGTEKDAVDVTVVTSNGTSSTSAADVFTYGPPVDPSVAVMMTLCTLAGTASAERPSGESVLQQEQRILAGINAQLVDTSLATNGQWQAVWLGLTQDRANLAYIASGPSQQLAVCLRGTQGFLIDIMQDAAVSRVLPFMGTSGGNISQGAMDAFTEILMGTSLLSALDALITSSTMPPLITVTGHSLGGALATTLGVFLADTYPQSTWQVTTFAAPTAGDAGFASAFYQRFPKAMCVANQYDIVPNAWWNLKGGTAQTPPAPESAEWFWPGMGLSDAVATWKIGLVGGIAGLAKSVDYVPLQPPGQAPLVLNPCFDDPKQPAASGIKTIEDWLDELAYQHNQSYLNLLGATQLPPVAPTVTGLNPASGPQSGNVSVTISGTGFTPTTVVDFGVVAATVVGVTTTSLTVSAPAGFGIVDVRVTNEFGTSEAKPADQFTYTSP